jgi:hypothetical protein
MERPTDQFADDEREQPQPETESDETPTGDEHFPGPEGDRSEEPGEQAEGA